MRQNAARPAIAAIAVMTRKMGRSSAESKAQRHLPCCHKCASSLNTRNHPPPDLGHSGATGGGSRHGSHSSCCGASRVPETFGGLLTQRSGFSGRRKCYFTDKNRVTQQATLGSQSRCWRRNCLPDRLGANSRMFRGDSCIRDLQSTGVCSEMIRTTSISGPAVASVARHHAATHYESSRR